METTDLEESLGVDVPNASLFEPMDEVAKFALDGEDSLLESKRVPSPLC